VTQMMACSCGSQFEEGDAFCGSCGNPRALSAPPPLAPLPFGDTVTGLPPTVSRPVVTQTSFPDDYARPDGRHTRQPYERAADMTRPAESSGPAPFDADSVYLQKTLRHEPMELGLDDSVSPRTLAVLAVRAWLAWLVVIVPLGLIGIAKAANGGSSTLLTVAVMISIIVFWVVLLRSKVTEPIGEWRTLLADRAGQSESYYRMINAVLRRRELPISALKLRSIQLDTKGGPVKHTIELSEHEYHTYVTVFPYGTSLYVGWQMWRRRSGAQLVKRALVDLLKGANLVTVMLRTDRARAVREAVHLACREAVYATPDDNLLVLAQQLRLPQVEQESVLLPQPASPVLPPPSTMAAPAPPPAAWGTQAAPRE
jgi:hypothetical protein